MELAIAFLRFTIDGIPANETHFLTPCESHDLEIEVRVSRWPENADELTLSPITVEPKSNYSFPVFQVTRPVGGAPLLLQQLGRAPLNVPQSLFARPFEFKYAASFRPGNVEQPIAVVGQRNLRIEGFDLRRAPLTGYVGVDHKILQVRNQLRTQPLISAAELENILVVLTPLCGLAGRAVQDALFREATSETKFQMALRDDLRRTPAIASELEEHAAGAGGITDLSFRGIRIELKYQGVRNMSVADCEQFVDQTVSYVVGTGKQVGMSAFSTIVRKSRPISCRGWNRGNDEDRSKHHDIHYRDPHSRESRSSECTLALISMCAIVYMTSSNMPRISMDDIDSAIRLPLNFCKRM